MTAKAKKTIKKVAGKLQKASKAHAGQAKTLSALKLKAGGSTVNKAGNYTKPTMRKRLFNSIKAGSKGGNPGQWSARKAQLLAARYKKSATGNTSSILSKVITFEQPTTLFPLRLTPITSAPSLLICFIIEPPREPVPTTTTLKPSIGLLSKVTNCLFFWFVIILVI